MPDKDKNELLKRLKEMNTIGKDAYIMSPDEDINFKCTNCGKCCVNPNVHFTPIDVYYASKKLGIQCFDFVKEYLMPYIGSSSGCIFNNVKLDKNNMCIFHDFDLSTGQHTCKLGDSRPFTCNIMPFGIVVGRQVDNINNTVGNAIIKSMLCGKQEYAGITADEYINSKMIMTDEEKAASDSLVILPSSIINTRVITEIFKDEKAVKIINKVANADLRSKILGTTIKFQYDFDINKSFMEQIPTAVQNLIINSISIAEVFICIVKGNFRENFINEEFASKIIHNSFSSAEEFQQACEKLGTINLYERYW